MDFLPLDLGVNTGSYSTFDTDLTLSQQLDIEIFEPGEDTGLNFDDFMLLMIQQLQSQTMDNTMDTTAMMEQMVQMSTVEMLSSVQESIDALVQTNVMSYSASLVGKTVTVGTYDDSGNLTETVGQVTGTGVYQGDQVIFVDGEMYPLNSIMAVGTLPAAPTPDEGEGETDTDADSSTEDNVTDEGEIETI